MWKSSQSASAISFLLLCSHANGTGRVAPGDGLRPFIAPRLLPFRHAAAAPLSSLPASSWVGGDVSGQWSCRSRTPDPDGLLPAAGVIGCSDLHT